MRFEAVILIGLVRVVMRLSGFWLIYTAFGLVRRVNRLHHKKRRVVDMHTVQRVFSTIDQVLQTHVFPSQCLYRSCVAHIMLFYRGIPSSFRIGVKSNPFSAHAWLEWNETPLMEAGSSDLRVVL